MGVTDVSPAELGARWCEGPLPRFIPVVLRCCSAVCFCVAAALGFPVESVIRLALLTVVLLAVKPLGLPRLFDTAFCGILLLATISGVKGWYHEISWLDNPAHLLVPSLLAALIYLGLEINGIIGTCDSRFQTIVISGLTLTFALAAAVVWELYEWVVVSVIGGRTVYVDYVDTMQDLAFGGLGGLVAGILLAYNLRRYVRGFNR